ncbi:MAG TPA: ECF transporter S component [Lachnospiraceae bacterium]|nr:ECF transporter S component [Lachnospiraceae bacterium]
MRYRLGIKEISATVFGSVAFIGISMFLLKHDCGKLSEYYFQIRLLLLTVMSALFGPIAGVLIGAGGSELSDMLIFGRASYISVLAFGTYGLFIGKYAKYYGIRDGLFNRHSAAAFNVIQMLSSMIIWGFIVPLLTFLANKQDLLEAEMAGLETTMFNAAAVCLVCTPVFWLIDQGMRLNRKRIDRKKKSKKDDGILHVPG